MVSHNNPLKNRAEDWIIVLNQAILRVNVNTIQFCGFPSLFLAHTRSIILESSLR